MCMFVPVMRNIENAKQQADGVIHSGNFISGKISVNSHASAILCR